MRIGICDDQKEIRDFIEKKVKSSYQEEHVIQYESGEAVLADVEQPDILFLDIQMPGIDGMAAARVLRQKNKQIIIIFVTAIEEYVFQAFDVGAFHYLVKPFTDDKFVEVLRNAVEQYRNRKKPDAEKQKKEAPSLLITIGGSHITVRHEDIIYAEVFNRKVKIHTKEGDIEYYGKLKDLEKSVGEGFFRSHRAYLVNFQYIKKYDASTIHLEKGQALMAKQNYQNFVKSYLKYNQRKERD